MAGFVPRLQAKVCDWPVVKSNETISNILKHPAGPFTIHFWAPTAKWLISIANIMDLSRPVEQMSATQQTAVTATGIVWSRYATQITPVNYNLLTVNAVMAVTGIWHLSRIIKARYVETTPPAALK